VTPVADGVVGTRQVLARGRVADALSGRGLPRPEVTLRFRHSGGSGVLPTTLALRADGWFALHVSPADVPDLGGSGPITVTARITVAGREPVELERVVDGARFARTTIAVDVLGTTSSAEVLAGPPLDLVVAIPPRPVALQGVVLRDHDPERPAAGVQVRADDGPDVTTDAAGRFVLAELPVAETVTLTVAENGQESSTPFRPDHSRPINTVTLTRP
jgi:hypothetical protein